MLDANAATKQSVKPSDVELHKTSVVHANPTPVKPQKAIERTEGAGLKITNWCRSHRPGLPWFATADSEGAASASAGLGSTTVVQGGRHGSLGAFVAHTEQAKMESIVMTTKQEGRLSKLDAAMQQTAEMMQNLMKAIATNDQQTKCSRGDVMKLGRRRIESSRRSKRLARYFRRRRRQRRSRRTAMRVWRPRLCPQLSLWLQTAQPSRLRKTHGRRRRAVVGVVAAGSDAGRGTGGPVSEDCDGLDDDGDDEQTVPSPSIAERTRSGIARRIAAIRLLANGGGSAGGPGATDTDAESGVSVNTELGWAEHIKQQYDVGDCSDARVAAVLGAIQRTESKLAQAGIDDMHF